MKDQKVYVKQSYTLNTTQKTNIISGELIKLTCGASSIKMESGGKVTISGTEFEFTAGSPILQLCVEDEYAREINLSPVQRENDLAP